MSPAGSAVCKFAGVSMTDTTQANRTGQFPDMVPSKYPSLSSWAQAQTDRLKSWGFNAAGQYSYAYNQYAGTNGLPAEIVEQVSGHAKRDDVSGGVEYYHCKSVNYDYAGMACAPTYKPPGGGQLDVFDSSCASGAGVAGAYMKDLGIGGNSNIYKSGAVGNIMFVTTEEGDDLYGINKVGHEDFGYVVAAHNPMMSVSLRGYAYPNKTLDAKIALRDFLANRYGCKDPVGGIGTPVPTGDNLHPSSAYCGSLAAASSLSVLNSAWGTNYTTWGTSDLNGEPGITSGIYISYGTGTGFLDENGSHLLATGVSCGNIKIDMSWAKKPAIITDLHDYVAYFSETYAQKLSAAWAQPAANPHPPIFTPLYSAPDYVYKAVAPYFDGFWVDAGLSITTLQRIIAAASVPGGKSMPLVIADYSNANPDSPFNSNAGFSTAPIQAGRGTAMANFWANALHQKDANGKNVVVGLEHWSFYDQANENNDYGLVTSDADNPFDGSAANLQVSTANTWQSNHGYVAPSIIFDGANYQALSGGITASCSSGSSAPGWAVTMGKTTADGTCIWRNEGPYPLKPQLSVPNSATLPGKAFGDMITPISTLLKGGICDSSVIVPPDTTAPSAPGNVAAVAASDSGINVSWTASTDVDSPVAGYFIYRDNMKVATVNGTSYSDTGLFANAAYSYSVSAYDAAGNISQAGMASATTLPSGSAVTPLVSLRASNLNSHRVQTSTAETVNLPAAYNGDIVIVQLVLRGSQTNVSVNVPAGYTAISEAAGNGGTFEGVYWHKWSAGDPTSVVFSWVNPAAPAWTVSTWVGADQINPIDVYAYATKGLRSTLHVAPSLTLNNRYDAVIRLSGIETYYGNSITNYPSGFTTLQAKIGDGVIPGIYLGVMGSTVTPTGSSTLITSISTYGVDHAVALRPAGGNTSTTPTVDTTAPSVPANLTASAVSSSQIDLAWTASTDVDSPVAGYNVYRGGALVATTSAISYSDRGLSANQAYSYTVSAYDPSGNTSAQSTLASATTQSTAGLYVGERVKATANLNVRRQACTTAKLLGTEPAGGLGTISGGPKSGCGYTWWSVKWDNRLSGWSVQDYLAPAATAYEVPAVGVSTEAQLANISTAMKQLLGQLKALLEEAASSLP